MAEQKQRENTFEAVVREWYAKKTAQPTPDYRKQIIYDMGLLNALRRMATKKAS